MIYTLIFEIGLIIALFLIKAVILYFLIKIFNKGGNFIAILKALFIFEIISLLIFYFYDCPFMVEFRVLVLDAFIPNLILAFCFLLASFIVFSFLLKKFTGLKWKNALIIFIILIFIMPMLDFVLKIITQPILHTPVFQKEKQEFALMLKEKGFFYGVLAIRDGDIWPIHNSIIGGASYLDDMMRFFH
jgi:hypothetical protein